ELDPSSRVAVAALAESLAAAGTTLVYTSHRSDEILPCTVRSSDIENGSLVTRGVHEPVSPYIAQAPHRARILPHPKKADSRALIKAENCDVYIDDTKILSCIDFTLREGYHTAVAGGNGSGKSTFLSFLSGEISPALGGSIERFGFGGQDALSLSQSQIGYASAALQSRCDPEDRAVDIVLSGFFSSLGTYNEASPEQHTRARELLVRFGIEDKADCCFSDLSYGQQRKAVLSRALAASPRVIILDEPMSGLDLSARAVLTDILEELAESGSTIVMAVHHAEDIPGFIRRIVALEKGKIISS
ncbi:MAG: ABC transporter ATP-binding protein, partial [Spirochaetota bacterium]